VKYRRLACRILLGMLCVSVQRLAWQRRHVLWGMRATSEHGGPACLPDCVVRCDFYQARCRLEPQDAQTGMHVTLRSMLVIHGTSCISIMLNGAC